MAPIIKLACNRISCCSNISISHELGCLRNSGCLGLSCLNLTDCGGGGGGLVGLGGLVRGAGGGLGSGVDGRLF